MNPLNDYPEVRKSLYLLQWIGNGLLLILAAVLTVLGESPLWYMATSAGWNAFCLYTGFTADQNTHVPTHKA